MALKRINNPPTNERCVDEQPNEWADLRRTLFVMRENIHGTIHKSIQKLEETVIQNQFQQFHELEDCYNQVKEFVDELFYDVYGDEL